MNSCLEQTAWKSKCLLELSHGFSSKETEGELAGHFCAQTAGMQKDQVHTQAFHSTQN